MATTSSSTKVTLLKLQEDGSNWVMYKERIVNHLTSKELLCHFSGTARKPIEVEEKNGKVHKKGNATAMTDDEFESYLDSLDMYAQKEAQVHKILYDMLTKTVIPQFKEQPTAADSWKKLISIFKSKGDMTVMNTLKTCHYPSMATICVCISQHFWSCKNDSLKWNIHYLTNNFLHMFTHP